MVKRMGVANDTLVWFCSDNGGLKGVGHDSVGGLRGNKGSLWEGGVRVTVPEALKKDLGVTDEPAPDDKAKRKAEREARRKARKEAKSNNQKNSDK